MGIKSDKSDWNGTGVCRDLEGNVLHVVGDSTTFKAVFPALNPDGWTLNSNSLNLYSIKPKDANAWKYCTPHYRVKASGTSTYFDWDFFWNPNRDCWEGLVVGGSYTSTTLNTNISWKNYPSRFYYKGFTNNVLMKQLDSSIDSSTFGKPLSSAKLQPTIDAVRMNPTCHSLSAAEQYIGQLFYMNIDSPVTSSSITSGWDVSKFAALPANEQVYTYQTLYAFNFPDDWDISTVISYAEFHTGGTPTYAYLDNVIDF